MPDEMADVTGKKVFFLYPHSVIQKELIQLIARYEYEVYLIFDHLKLPALLTEYPQSIVFINIDEKMPVERWEYYISKLREHPSTKNILIGILTYNEDRELARHFLLDLMVQAGFVQLKLGLKESAHIILRTLSANEAKGRRKFVRVQLPDDSSAKINIKLGESYLTGTVSDISSGGMACIFNEDPGALKNIPLTDIQLNLKGKITKASGKVAGTRQSGGKTVHIIIFETFRNEIDRLNLANFINKTLQAQMDRKLAAIKTPE
jgi:hypothetical protein